MSDEGMQMTASYADRLAVVMGAGSGIGAALAERLAAEGATVVATDIDAARIGDVVERMVADGGRAFARTVDVADAASVDALAEELFAEHDHVDLLINNAGLQTAGPVWEADPARWEQMMRVNIDGVFHGIRFFVPRMLATGRPATVVNLSSVGGAAIVPFQSSYVASKHAVLALTECLHQELQLVGAPIQVSVVLPSYVRTRIFVDAQRVAPTGNDLAAAYFDRMEQIGQEQGKSPAEAAAAILAGVAGGDFWVFTDDAAGQRVLTLRAEQLAGLRRPPDARPRLREMGLDV
ncbi:MAG: SDR family NAD(P)-dependent oxidoreductase [Nocardioides sp.]|uniref:SDR family NAD(P)-dependent oxidoreductase n=1 Tax=Nocardioides sp. TaxID=35761 RepID=UPI0039E463C2